MKKTYYQKYYEKNKEKRKRESLEYSKSHGNASQKLYGVGYRKKLRDAVYELLGKKCNLCGFDDVRALQVDHINGGGSKERKNTTRNLNAVIIESIIKKENRYQLLCANCNWIKRSINNENRK